MKTLIASTAMIVALAGSASAMTTAKDTLTSLEKAEASRFVPNADLDNLTAEQVDGIRASLFNGEDNDQRKGVVSAVN